MTEFPAIETKHVLLTLQQPDNAHLGLAYYLANRNHLAPWEPAREDDFYTAGSSLARGEKSIRLFMEGSALNFIAIEHTSQKMIAGCNFTNIVRGPLMACHLGYSVAKEFEGRGLMQEIVNAGITFVFESLGLHRIMANHVPYNTRSENLLRNLGFEREGYARAYLKIGGIWEDMVLNSLINPNMQ